MPSLFSRSRTQSSPFNNPSLAVNPHDAAPIDEFGRVHSRSSHSPTSNKKERNRKKDRDQDKTRSRTPGGDYELPTLIPEGSFLPLNLERPRDESGDERPKEHDYGHLSHQRHVVLGLEQAERLVEVVAEELNTRGLTTPFIFSSLALNISTSAIKRLIQTFLHTCENPGSRDAERSWLEEARFANPPELGMFLRWGLARLVRYSGGEDVRGLLLWDQYNSFCETEAALNYPPAHFLTLLPELEPRVANILIKLLTVLTGLTAHSSSSGHTPPTLSPLFGPLIFGLGAATLPFHHAYIHYLRAANATEHLILAFIRWQDTPRLTPSDSSSAVSYSTTALGVPTRLKYWIRGYPFAMLPFLEDRNHKTKPQARRGARTVRVVSVRRNVRMYSPDLVRTCASWAQRASPGARPNELAASKEWGRICPPALKLPPRYSEAFKKRMDLPSAFHPDTGPGMGGVGMLGGGLSKSSSASSTTTSGSQDQFGLGQGLMSGREDRFTSLADMRWGEFETMGFSGLDTTEKKLQFDLTEGARNARAVKRTTLNWNDFSTTGFSRTDGPLSATLQFSPPVAHTISVWPTHSAEISKKLKKTQKALPPFGWDTEPVMGAEEVIEEAFLDVFCDLVYGGGWMDLERVEETDRECNWALVEFKAFPHGQMPTPTPDSDPRTANSIMLFEEFVPLEYRQQLVASSTARTRFPSLFHSKASKQWKPAATLNGRPYVVGLVPHSPSLRELEFDSLLRSTTGTKVISASHGSSNRRPTSSQSHEVPRFSFVSTQTQQPTLDVPRAGRTSAQQSDATLSPTSAGKKTSRFRLPGGIPVPSPGGARKSGIAPAEYSTVDFETRLASYSDDEFNGSQDVGGGKKKGKHDRRESRDDAWVDILVGSQERRMGGQDADLKRPGLRGLRGGRSDPELASQEVAKALAAVKERAPSTDDGADTIEPYTTRRPSDRSFDRTPNDLTVMVDEVQTVPSAHTLAVLDGLDGGEDDEDAAALAARKKKRMGYFDLHPDRRLMTARASYEDDDPRALLHADSDDADDEDGPSETKTPLAAPASASASAPVPPPKSKRYSNDSAIDGFEGGGVPTLAAPVHAAPMQIEIPEWTGGVIKPSSERHHATQAEDDEDDDEEEEEGGTGFSNGSSTKPTATSAGRTAALIEMYRQRELRTGAVSSRLPVRAGSSAAAASPKEPTSSSPLSGVVPAVAVGTPSPAPVQAKGVLPDASLLDPHGAEEGRYVHGSPLHNVLEEEEEEV